MMKKVFFILLFLLFLLSGEFSVVLATEASVKCAPTTGTYSVGDIFTVDYTIDTRAFPIYGADIEATYDQGIIEAQGTQSSPITGSTGWGQPVKNAIDVTSGKTGKISLDYGNTQPAYTGTGSVGQITFKAKAAGQAQFNYIFFQQYDDTTPGVAKVWGKRDNTTLSNILTDVNNCIYVITDASPTATPIPTVQPTRPPVVTELPRSGAVENSLAILGISVLFISLGLILPSLLSSKSG
jgi:hypothetical protein